MTLIIDDRSTIEKENPSMENLCKKILEIKNIQFAGIIDTMGNLYAGGFKQGINPKLGDAERSQMYMKFALESCFRKDFDESLGTFRSAIIQRDSSTIFTFNICHYLLLVLTDSPNVNGSLMTKIQNIVHKNKKEIYHS
ncbi:MAG: hypothetical protein PVI88_05790 [Nitrosopumilaceae archaeon]|jgi:hypothetical protein